MENLSQHFSPFDVATRILQAVPRGCCSKCLSPGTAPLVCAGARGFEICSAVSLSLCAVSVGSCTLHPPTGILEAASPPRELF